MDIWTYFFFSVNWIKLWVEKIQLKRLVASQSIRDNDEKVLTGTHSLECLSVPKGKQIFFPFHFPYESKKKIVFLPHMTQMRIVIDFLCSRACVSSFTRIICSISLSSIKFYVARITEFMNSNCCCFFMFSSMDLKLSSDICNDFISRGFNYNLIMKKGFWTKALSLEAVSINFLSLRVIKQRTKVIGNTTRAGVFEVEMISLKFKIKRFLNFSRLNFLFAEQMLWFLEFWNGNFEWQKLFSEIYHTKRHWN